MKTVAAYPGAALAEVAGCLAFWAWLRLDRSVWWIAPERGSLALFAYLLIFVDSAIAGRTYTAYDGVYIASSFVFKRVRPDHQDAAGVIICLIGAAVIIGGPW